MHLEKQGMKRKGRTDPTKEEDMAIQFDVAAFKTKRLFQRECPICGHTQMIPLSKMREAVTCERCDYGIRPPRKIAA